MLENGTLLQGKYEILKKIGQGGTATTYLAMNQKLNQQWVIKEIDLKNDWNNSRRVLREARLMMRFDHPAIPRVVDILEEEQFTYIIMDYIPGRSLAHELSENGPFSQDIVVEWAKQICQIFIYLHSLNPPIIYHDLKPGNIILKEPERNLKLIDFGEARPYVQGARYQEGSTREYAAPEQQKGNLGNTDERTDIYCLGTTLYRLLSENFVPTFPNQVGSIRARFPQLKISKGMDHILQKCTQKDPGKRFQNAGELMQALENIQLWDEDYIKQLKRRVNLVRLFICFCIAAFFAGIAFRFGAVALNRKDYMNLVNTVQSAEYEIRVEALEKAIELDGANPIAYKKLIETYENNGRFGIEESRQFSTLYNRHKNEFDNEQETVIEMHYLIGRSYFNLYFDGSDSIRSRVLKAKEYFQYVKEYGNLEFENYDIACSYYTLCDFFKNYVLNDSSIQEPTKDTYQEMMEALSTCISDMQAYSESDAAYTRLTLYEYILDMLNVNLRGFAVNGIDKNEITEIVAQITHVVKTESITQQASVRKREKILCSIENILENIRREYADLERGEIYGK